MILKIIVPVIFSSDGYALAVWQLLLWQQNCRLRNARKLWFKEIRERSGHFMQKEILHDHGQHFNNVA